MDSQAGTSLGHYEILTLLGRGGMGEVYCARDTRLNRTVAIKFLAAGLADATSRRRFQQEAQTASGLNHPHILTVFEAGESDDRQYLVTEFVDGGTLGEWIRSGRRSWQQVVDLLTGVADGLASAHAAGIVHRDVKPGNILVTKNGYAKLADFGLAKLTAVSEDDVTRAEEHHTRPGVVVGTVAYMSPEQLSGAPADARSDVFSFGIVLYESLAGRRPFSGASETLAAQEILHGTPPPLDASIPPAVAHIVEKALERDCADRYQSMRELVVDLRRATRATTSSRGQPQPVGSRSSLGGPRAWAAGALLLGLGAGASGWLARGSGPTTAQPNPLASATFSRLTDFPGTETQARISPDGRFAAFLADRDGEFDIWVTQIGTGRFTNLTRDLPPLSSFFVVAPLGFSGDGADVWFRLSNRVVRMPILGGMPSVFLGEPSQHPSWSADGRRLLYQDAVDGDPTFVADPTGANARRLFIDEPGVHNHNALWSLDGQWIYYVHGRDVGEQMDVWRARVADGRTEPLTRLQSAAVTVAPIDARTVLYVAPAEDRSGPWLWALDVERRTSVRASTGIEQYTSVAASADGRRVVATVANPVANLWSVPIGNRPAGNDDLRPYAVPTVRALAPRFRGTSLYYLSARGTGDGLWRMENGDASEVWRGVDGALGDPAAVAPDGQRIAIVLRDAGKRRLTVMAADGSGAQRVAESIDAQGAPDWSPDGTSLVTGGSDASGPGLFRVPLDGGATVRLITGAAGNPVWAPDGSTIVYNGPNIGGRQQLRAVNSDGTNVALPDLAVSADIRQGHRFMPDGRLVIVRSVPGSAPHQFVAVDLATKALTVLARFDSPGAIRAFDITPDGRQIVFDRHSDNSDIVLIDLPR